MNYRERAQRIYMGHVPMECVPICKPHRAIIVALEEAHEKGVQDAFAIERRQWLEAYGGKPQEWLDNCTHTDRADTVCHACAIGGMRAVDSSKRAKRRRRK